MCLILQAVPQIQFLEKDAYFEFKIEKHDLTSDVFLVITSTSENGNQEIEEEDWKLMTKKLRNCIGG